MSDRMVTPEETGLGEDWAPGTYFWLKGRTFYASMLIAKKPGDGAFHRLREWCLSNGLELRVPIPMGRMESILRLSGFKKSTEWAEAYGDTIPVWVSP